MEIHWRNVEDLAEPQREAAEARIRALAEGRTDLIDVRIVARTTRHHRHGAQEVTLTCQARGQELVATRTRDDLGAALDEVLDAFEREVWRMRDRRTGQRSERPAGPPELGVIDRVFRADGYGFILTDSGDSVYFHRNAVQGLDFEALAEGQRVGLNIEPGDKGPQANAVVPAPPDAPGP
jgi:cold shock CspA family protein/ribosome-associated translation inhibitor RaiA